MGPRSPFLLPASAFTPGTALQASSGTVSGPTIPWSALPRRFAVRLEALNETFGTSILVSERVREAAGPGFLVRMLGTIAAGSLPGRVRVYELLAEKDGPQLPEARLIAEFEAGLGRFEKGDPAGALALFSQVLAQFPVDGPSAAYARRCRQLLEHGGRPDVTSFPW